MDSKVLIIELVSSLRGTFKFTEHNALHNFEKCNWPSLGEVTYTVIREFKDGTICTVAHTGINASYLLENDLGL